MASRLLALVALVVSPAALAADRNTTERLRDLETESGKIGSEVEDTRLNFTERSGLIGVGEARRRYEDAVYGYLVGDFESAATGFYILVQSRALGNAELARDSEWYLAECLFELGNLRTSEEAFRAIVDTGSKHPYFADAARRNLEVYALIGDDASFTSYYNTYIVTGRVPGTDLVNYTLAKSFVRRGDLPRAKALFEAIGSSSAYYTRARYQLGVLMIQERNLPAAIAEFQKVEGTPVSDADQERIQELSILALGRLFYETGDFAAASTFYERIDRSSGEFADKLYESVWSFVKQERYEAALGQVDSFLGAFPEHRYTAQMKVLQGHLHMKLRHYDAARNSYEEVVEAYTPVAMRLDDLSQGTTQARQFLERIGDTGGTSGIPPYALETLIGRDDVSRAMKVYLDVDQTRQDLEEAERIVADLESALSAESDTLGMFVAARNQLTTMRGAALAMRARLLQTEIGYLKGRSSATTKPELASLGREVVTAGGAETPLDSGVSVATDKLLVYEAQVREVQQRAFRVQQVAEEYTASGRSIAEVLSSGSTRLSPADQERIRGELETARKDLAAAAVELESLQSEVTRRKIMRTVEAGSVSEDSNARAQNLATLQTLRDRLATYRRGVQDTDSASIYAQIDRLWSALDTLEATSTEAARVVATGEARETQAVRQRLAATAQKVTELRRDLGAESANTEAVAARIVLGGLRDLRDQFESDVVDADKGIVDVYWLRKSETGEEQDLLIKQQAEMLQELDDRFRIIRENLDR